MNPERGEELDISPAQSLHASTGIPTPAIDVVSFLEGFFALVTIILIVLLLALTVGIAIDAHKFRRASNATQREEAYNDASGTGIVRAIILGLLTGSTFGLALFYTTMYWQQLADASRDGCVQTDTYPDGTTLSYCTWSMDGLDGSSAPTTDVFWMVVAWMGFTAALILFIMQLIARPWEEYSETSMGIEDHYEKMVSDLMKHHEAEEGALKALNREQDEKLRTLLAEPSPEGEHGTAEAEPEATGEPDHLSEG